MFKNWQNDVIRNHASGCFSGGKKNVVVGNGYKGEFLGYRQHSVKFYSFSQVVLRWVCSFRDNHWTGIIPFQIHIKYICVVQTLHTAIKNNFVHISNWVNLGYCVNENTWIEVKNFVNFLNAIYFYIHKYM